MSATEESQFKTVLVAANLSYSGSSALRYARSIAQAYKATLVIVHCIDPVSYAFPDGVPEAVLADPLAREELMKIEQETSKQAFPPHSALEQETVYERLIGAAQDCRADLLVLGTRATTVLGRLALGSVAMHLLAHAPCPVLCVPAAETAAAPTVFSEILFAG